MNNNIPTPNETINPSTSNETINNGHNNTGRVTRLQAKANNIIIDDNPNYKYPNTTPHHALIKKIGKARSREKIQYKGMKIGQIVLLRQDAKQAKAIQLEKVRSLKQSIVSTPNKVLAPGDVVLNNYEGNCSDGDNADAGGGDDDDDGNNEEQFPPLPPLPPQLINYPPDHPQNEIVQLQDTSNNIQVAGQNVLESEQENNALS